MQIHVIPYPSDSTPPQWFHRSTQLTHGFWWLYSKPNGDFHPGDHRDVEVVHDASETGEASNLLQNLARLLLGLVDLWGTTVITW